MACCIILVSCAGQVPPQGGPVDTEPPFITTTFPADYSTGFTGDRIVLEFNEYVDRSSVQQSVFISPDVGSLEFDWSGREVEILFFEPLRDNSTYVVNVGTDVVDIRNRNRMAEAATLAFSTGTTIDPGMIEGFIVPRKRGDERSGVMIFAYQVDGLESDTLDPTRVKPDYVTQTGTEGRFVLRHLRLGRYRIVAVRDEFRNLLYDRETDDFGVPAFEPALTR
ncbi:MAG: Ig-like domain-containing protein, partial [Bacteroidota bacterium]